MVDSWELVARSLLTPLAQENTSPAHRDLWAECCYSDSRSCCTQQVCFLRCPAQCFCLVLCLQGSCSVPLKSDQLLLRWWLVMLTHSMGIPQRRKMVFSAEVGLYCLLHSTEVALPSPLLLFPHSKLTVSLRSHANTEINAKTTEHLTVCKSSVISKN